MAGAVDQDLSPSVRECSCHGPALDPHRRWWPIFENFIFNHKSRAAQDPFFGKPIECKHDVITDHTNTMPSRNYTDVNSEMKNSKIPTVLWPIAPVAYAMGWHNSTTWSRNHEGIYVLQIRLATRKMGIRPPDQTTTTNHSIPIAVT